ncbi:hypothetical protein D6783_05850, partial [Candidatus Woesearchaeota archaeon]
LQSHPPPTTPLRTARMDPIQLLKKDASKNGEFKKQERTPACEKGCVKQRGIPKARENACMPACHREGRSPVAFPKAQSLSRDGHVATLLAMTTHL